MGERMAWAFGLKAACLRMHLTIIGYEGILYDNEMVQTLAMERNMFPLSCLLSVTSQFMFEDEKRRRDKKKRREEEEGEEEEEKKEREGG